MIAPPVFEPFLDHARYKIAYGGRGCYPGDTEFMSQNGWRRIDQYEIGDQVKCFDRATGNFYFSLDVDYIDLPTDEFVTIKNKNVDFTTSINHKHLTAYHKNNGCLALNTIRTYQIYGRNSSILKDFSLVNGEGDKISPYDCRDCDTIRINNDSRMYCFTTPTGFFPVRQKGRIYVSGNSGKSWSIARILVELSRRSKIRILCARELQSSIADSVIQLLSDTIDRNGYLKEFDVLKTEIVHKQTGSRFMFYGIRHNITKIKSVEGIDICWVEEAENVQKDSWDILIPTIRKDDSEIWVSFNPKNILDDTYTRFVSSPPSNSVVIKVNYTDNPHFPDVLREEMEQCKKLDYELYRHIWEGEPVADSEHAIIKPVWVEAAIDAHIRLGFSASGNHQVGYDVSDEGEDASSMVGRKGSVVNKIDLWRKRPQEFCTKSVYNYCYLNDVDLLVFDSIGVGAGAKIVIRGLNKDAAGSVRSMGFNAGGKVKNPNASFMVGANKKNKDMFSNVKAQEWWRVRQRFYNTYLSVKEGADFRSDELISLSSKLDHIDLLQAELSRPRVDYDRNGRTKVEAKVDMAKRGIPSTNVADGLIMAYSGGIRGSAGLIC